MYISDFGDICYRSLWQRGADGSTVKAAVLRWQAWINRSRPQHELELTRTGRHQLTSSTWVVAAHQHTDAGRAAALASITHTQQTRRVTCSTAVEGPEQGWCQTVVYQSGPELQKTYPPGFEADLRSELGAMDGTRPLPKNTPATPAQEPRAAEALADPGRLLPVVLLVPPPGGPPPVWWDLHESAFFQLRGMCAAYLLQAEEQETVSALLPQTELRPGRALVVPPFPAMDDQPGQISHLRLNERTHTDLVGQVLDHAVHALPPPHVRSLMDQVQQSLSDLSPQARPTESGKEGHPEAGEEGHRQRAGRLKAQLKSTQAELARARSLEADLLHLRGERDHALDDLAQVRFENSWLREQAAGQGLYQLAGARAPHQVRSRPAPERVPELLEAITDADALPYLHMSLDERAVHELAHDGQERLWIARAWEALGALNDWARYHHEHPGNGLGLHDYLKHAPPGYRTIPAGRFSASESNTVRQHKKLRTQREFAVPTDVDPSGKAPMYAHIRLDTTHGICPRLHFLPDMARQRPRLLIGYLGPHLQVATTN